MEMHVNPPSVLALVLSLTLPLFCVSAEVFFEERFEDGWENRWVKSNWKKDEKMAGKWNHTAGKWSADPQDKGIQTTKAYRFYAISAEFPEFSNENKTLVFQFSAKREEIYGCGGLYMKLISGRIDQKKFGGDTPYSIMFGPDICGMFTRQIQAVLWKNGKGYQMNRELEWKPDQLTHVYTFIIRPDNTYSILVDNAEKKSGSLYEDWDIPPLKRIEDPEAKKPEDWDDRMYIPAPGTEEPEDSDYIAKEIPDTDDKRPDNWDEEKDGEWKPKMIPNPEYDATWNENRIRNPNYKGQWYPPLIDNPDYCEDPKLYVFPGLRYVGIDLWQTKPGNLFDNILICDDPSYAKKFAEDTWGKHKDAEKKAYEFAERKRLIEEDTANVQKQDEVNDEEEVEEDDRNTTPGSETETSSNDEL